MRLMAALKSVDAVLLQFLFFIFFYYCVLSELIQASGRQIAKPSGLALARMPPLCAYMYARMYTYVCMCVCVSVCVCVDFFGMNRRVDR